MTVQKSSFSCAVIFQIINISKPYFATPVSVSFKELMSRSMPLKLRPFDNVHVSLYPINQMSFILLLVNDLAFIIHRTPMHNVSCL